MKDDDILALLLQKLRWLRLPGMAKAIAAILECVFRPIVNTDSTAS